MTKYNVLVGVVDGEVVADHPQAAIQELEGRLRAAGFETYSDGTTQLPHAFESEES